MGILAALIRGGATAIPAIPATHERRNDPTVATVATIAVAGGGFAGVNSEQYAREERAAIYEFEAGLTRTEAEQKAGMYVH